MTIAFSLFVAVAGAPSVEERSGDVARAKVAMGAPRNGLLLHYSFDRNAGEKLIDQSAHGRHGALHGRIRYVDGVRGKALHLTGAGVTGGGGGHASLPSVEFSKLKEFTVALWVKESRLTYAHGEAYVVFGADRGTTYDGSLCIGHFNGEIHFRVGRGYVSVPFAKADRDRWVHYALTFRDDRVRGYKDGRLVADGPARVSASGKQAALGRHWWHGGGATSTRFVGALDEVRVYDRALSKRQVQGLKQWTESGE